MSEATPPGVTPLNLRKDLHSALEPSHELGINLYVATQASLIADAGVATGHDDPALCPSSEVKPVERAAAR